MNLFGWRKNLSISEQDPTFKVRYLGNIQTALMKGEGCVDRPTSVIWNNYKRSDNIGLEMTVVVTGSGMKAYTKEQGLTEYRAHRISYCIAHPAYPRLFVWVYRHDGRKMKMELRCHAVMCKSEAKAKTMALQLHQKLSFALKEFQREKLRKQNSRLTLQRTKTLSKTGNVLPLRTQLLSTAKNFRPPVSTSPTASKLGSIMEDDEDDSVGVDEEEMIKLMTHHGLKRGSVGARLEGNNNNNCMSLAASARASPSGLFHNGREHHDILEALDLESADSFDAAYFASDPIIDLEIGNDLDELRRDDAVKFCLNNGTDSDEESAESGYHDQDQDVMESEKEKEMVKELPDVEEDEEYADSVCQMPSFDTEFAQAQSTSKNVSL